MNSSNSNCSIIPQPVTENYKFQSLSTIFASIKKFKKGQMSPLNPLVVKYNVASLGVIMLALASIPSS